MKETLSLRNEVEGPDLKEFAKKMYANGSQKNDVLLKENVKTTKTVQKRKRSSNV